MTDILTLNRANKTVDHLFLLDDEISNGQAFLILLETLHNHDLSSIPSLHVAGIEMVRAGILRAAISSVLACLDLPDHRNNRASIGQILKMLEDHDIQEIFIKAVDDKDHRLNLLKDAQMKFENLVKEEGFKKLRNLRNNKIGHNLLHEKRGEEVGYSEINDYFFKARKLTGDLLEFCACNKPRFEEVQFLSRNNAQIFWSTYFNGLS